MSLSGRSGVPRCDQFPLKRSRRRGIGAVDELLEGGPVYVITHNRPRYVILDAEQYRELLAEREEAYRARIRAARADVAAGRVQRFDNAGDLLAAIDAADERAEDTA